MAKLGQIKIKGERKVQMVELDLDIDDQTIDTLAYHGFNMIKYEREELACYAFRKALEAWVKGNKECGLQIKPGRRKRGNKSH
jgi:hypothetical protein